MMIVKPVLWPVVLLDVLDRLKESFSLDLVVAHFDHSLRPDDDDRETRFVASLAASKNLPFVTQKALSPGKSGMSLEEEALQHITDPSNFEKHHLRNRIRLELLPQLKTYQPRIVEILGQTAGIMRDETRWMETEAEDWIKAHVEVFKTGTHSVPVKAFGELAAALQSQVLRQIIKGVQGELRRISLRHIEAIKGLVQGRPQASLDLPNNVFVKKTYETLIFSKNREKQEPKKTKRFQYVLDGPGVFNLDAISCTVTIEEIKGKAPLPGENASQDSISCQKKPSPVMPGKRPHLDMRPET